MNRSFAAYQLTVEAPAFILFRASIYRVMREQICWQTWIQHVEKPPCANFWSIWGNQWCLTAYCKFRLMTRRSDFERQPLL